MTGSIDATFKARCSECGNPDLAWPEPGCVVRRGVNFNPETDAFCPQCEWYGDPDVAPYGVLPPYVLESIEDSKEAYERVAGVISNRLTWQGNLYRLDDDGVWRLVEEP